MNPALAAPFGGKRDIYSDAARTMKLQERIEILEEENRQLRKMMQPSLQFVPEWKLTAQQGQLLALIYSRALVTYDQIVVAFDIRRQVDGNDDQNHVKVVAHHVRRKLAPFGIKFTTVFGVGYAADSENKARIRAGLLSTGNVEN